MSIDMSIDMSWIVWTRLYGILYHKYPLSRLTKLSAVNISAAYSRLHSPIMPLSQKKVIFEKLILLSNKKNPLQIIIHIMPYQPAHPRKGYQIMLPIRPRRMQKSREKVEKT